jgi:hypothetical protein
LQILGLGRVFRGFVGLEMEVAAGDGIAKEGGNDLIRYDEKDLENRQGSSWKKGFMGNTKKDWRSGVIRAAGVMGQTRTTLADFFCCKNDAISAGKRLILCAIGLSAALRESEPDGRWMIRFAP